MNSYSVAAILKASGASQFINDFKNAQQSVESFVKANEKSFESMRQVGKFAMAGGLAVGAGLGVAVKTAANFEQAMSQVKAISGATGDEFNSLRDKAIEMGAKTAFSASESADAMANLAQMGWKTDQILGGIEHTLNLAAAGGLELADSALLMANTMNQFGLETSDAERVADVFALTASSAGTDVSELGLALEYAGAGAAAAGMSIEETAAFIGVLGDAGITGSKAGTALNAMLRDLKANAEDGKVAIGDQTVALYDSEGKMRSMPDVISEVIRATEKMSDEQRDAALSAIFGEQALQGFNNVASQGADAVSELAAELYDSEGAAKDMADIMMDNLNGALTELGSAFEGVQIAIGTALIPAIRLATEMLTKLADWFNNLSDTTKSTIAIFLAVTAVALTLGGALLLLAGSLPLIISGFGHLRNAFTLVRTAVLAFNSAILANPITWVVVAMIAAVALIYVYWEPIKEFFLMLWEAIKESGLLIWENLKEGWANAVENITQAWDSVKEFFSNLWESIKEIFTSAWDAIVTIVTTFVDVIKSVITTIFNAIKTYFTTVLNVYKTIFTTTWNAIKTVVTSVVNGIRSVITTVFNTIRTIITSVMNVIRNVISTVWNAIRTVITTVVNAIRSVISSVFNAIRSVISGVMNSIRSTISSIWNAIRSIITSVTNSIRSTISNIFNSLRGIVSGAMNGVRSAVSSGIKGALNVVTNMVKNFFNAGKNIVGAIADGIKASVGKVTGAMGNLASKARAFLPFSPAKEGAFRDIMKIQIPQSIAKSIEKGKGTAFKAMDNLTSGMNDRMNINGRVSSLDGMSRTVNRELNAQLNVGKQPAIINVHVGSKQIASEIVDDITEIQDRNKYVRKAFV